MHPYRRLLSRDKSLPPTTFDHFSPLRSIRAIPTPDLWPQTHRVFVRVVSAVRLRPLHPSGARPRDVSPPGQTSAPGTCGAPANRRDPAASNRMMLTHALAPFGAAFPLAHSSGGARLNHAWVGQLSWGEARTHQSHGCAPSFLPVSHRNPTGGSTSAKRLVDLKGTAARGHGSHRHAVTSPSRIASSRCSANSKRCPTLSPHGL